MSEACRGEARLARVIMGLATPGCLLATPPKRSTCLVYSINERVRHCEAPESLTYNAV
ncbi:MAG: hypothetical protein LBM98_09685 [Oscillospiraceae bacterium]|nr:hypothetical protein [Oscillospiraceae bacterium]